MDPFLALSRFLLKFEPISKSLEILQYNFGVMLSEIGYNLEQIHVIYILFFRSLPIRLNSIKFLFSRPCLC